MNIAIVKLSFRMLVVSTIFFWLNLGLVVAGENLQTVSNVKGYTKIDTLRYGARIIKESIDDRSAYPKIEILNNLNDWRVKEGEAWTGMNGREFFFTLEAAGKDLPAPAVRITWEGVHIDRIIGADGATSIERGRAEFTLRQQRAPTSISTRLDYGPVKMTIFHNWEMRRAGPYRHIAWPANKIQAQLNFLFAAREMCKHMGFTEDKEVPFNGDIRLYGFETNFPNGHVDHPEHFHIMLGWPGWEGTQVGHFILDDTGKILRNVFQSYFYGTTLISDTIMPNEVCRMYDPDGKLGFETIITEDGSGVIMREREGGPEFRISASGDKLGALGSVDVYRRGAGETPWFFICKVRAEDDASEGRMMVSVIASNGVETVEDITYDVDTGGLLDVKTKRRQVESEY